MFRKSVAVIFYGNIFIAICAVVMCMQTNMMLHLPLNDVRLYMFVFGGVLVQYNLHHLLKKDSHAGSTHFTWSQENRNLHLILTGVGSIAVIAGVPVFSGNQIVILFCLGLVTLLYSLPVLPFRRKKRLKDFGIIKIAVLVMFWALITAWLPVARLSFTVSAFTFVFTERILFLCTICLLFDIRDAGIDGKERISTIPVIIGVRKTYIVAYILLIAFASLAIYQYLPGGELRYLNALLVSAAVTFLMIHLVKRRPVDIAYLTCIDGMLLLQAVLVMIASI